MASSARHLFQLLAFVAVLAATTPRAGAWSGSRLFFSKTTRPEAAVDEPAEKATAAASVVTVPAADAPDPDSAAAFSTGGGGGRGYGLYGRPEDNFPPDYFRRGVHRNAEKLTTTTTTTSAGESSVPVGGRGERAEPSSAEDDSHGSGRGRRTTWTATNVPATTRTEETTGPVMTGGGEPFVEDNGSGRGRPPRYHGPEEQRNYGMSDTGLYQNGRYYYDVDAGRYGYGRESNPVRTRPEEFVNDRRGRYSDAVGGNGVMHGFQEEAQNGRYIP